MVYIFSIFLLLANNANQRMHLVYKAQRKYLNINNNYKLFDNLEYNRNKCAELRVLFETNDTICMMEAANNPIVTSESKYTFHYVCLISTGNGKVFRMYNECPVIAVNGQVTGKQCTSPKIEEINTTINDESDFIDCYQYLIQRWDTVAMKQDLNHTRACLDCPSVVITRVIGNKVDVCASRYSSCK